MSKSLDDVRARMSGQWDLFSMLAEPVDEGEGNGEGEHPPTLTLMGATPKGGIIYHPDGHMMAQLHSSDPYEEDTQPNGVVKSSGKRNFVVYAAKYDLHIHEAEDNSKYLTTRIGGKEGDLIKCKIEGEVRHDVQDSLDPAWVGLKLQRHVAFHTEPSRGWEYMILKPLDVQTMLGRDYYLTIVWRRQGAK